MFALQHISAVFVADQFYPLMVMLLNYQVLWQMRQGSRVQPIWDYCRCCSHDMIVEVGLVTQVSFRSCLFLQHTVLFPVLPVYDCSFNLGVTWASALIYLLVWRVSFSSWFLESNWGLSKVSISSCMVYWLNFSITFLRLSLLDCQIEIHWEFLMPLRLYNMERMLPCIEVVVC